MVKHLETDLDGLFLFELTAFGDARGSFMEVYRKERYSAHGLDIEFVQDNLSISKRGVLRGLHAQSPSPQGKLVSALRGEIWDVAVDIRAGSPTFGQWRGFTLSSENHHQLYVPPGFLHGFVVLSEEAYVSYKVTCSHDPAGDFSVRWDDPELAIEWPIHEPILSAKDATASLLREVEHRFIPYAAP